MKRSQAKRELAKDILYICIGVGLAVLAVRSGTIDMLIHMLGGQLVASFAAGIFFTSAFTLAPASVALSHIAAETPLSAVALWGGFGAMCGDLALFLFIRDKFASDIRYALKPSFSRHVVSSFHFGFMKWLGPLLGAAIIASPLPDEFGLALMGMSRTRLYILLPVSFAMNVVGVYVIASLGHLL